MLIDRGSGKAKRPQRRHVHSLGQDNYVVDRNGAGVTLQNPPRRHDGASGYADGAMVYIVRYGPGGTVSLVDEATVAAAQAKQKVNLKGFDDLGTAVSDQPGVAAVAGGYLWILAGSGSSCRVVQEVPVAIGHQGLLSTVRANVPSKCTEVAAEAASGVVSVAYPGHVRLFLPGGSGSGVDVAVGGTANDSRFRPVTGTSGTLWFLAGGGQQGSVFGVTPDGRVTVPSSLRHFGLGTLPATPVLSDGDAVHPGPERRPTRAVADRSLVRSHDWRQDGEGDDDLPGPHSGKGCPVRKRPGLGGWPPSRVQQPVELAGGHGVYRRFAAPAYHKQILGGVGQRVGGRPMSRGAARARRPRGSSNPETTSPRRSNR